MPPAPNSCRIRYFAGSATSASWREREHGRAPWGCQGTDASAAILDPMVDRDRVGGRSMTRDLGLDVGDVRIGSALSDETATLASGPPTLKRVGPRKDLKAGAALVREHGVGPGVVGSRR